MPEPNYMRAGLKALLDIMRTATPENQPQPHVLTTFLELLRLVEAPTESQVAEFVQRLKHLESTLAMEETRKTQGQRLFDRQLMRGRRG